MPRQGHDSLCEKGYLQCPPVLRMNIESFPCQQHFPFPLCQIEAAGDFPAFVHEFAMDFSTLSHCLADTRKLDFIVFFNSVVFPLLYQYGQDSEID